MDISGDVWPFPKWKQLSFIEKIGAIHGITTRRNGEFVDPQCVPSAEEYLHIERWKVSARPHLTVHMSPEDREFFARSSQAGWPRVSGGGSVKY
jgi:hypothetical protein